MDPGTEEMMFQVQVPAQTAWMRLGHAVPSCYCRLNAEGGATRKAGTFPGAPGVRPLYKGDKAPSHPGCPSSLSLSVFRNGRNTIIIQIPRHPLSIPISP